MKKIIAALFTSLVITASFASACRAQDVSPPSIPTHSTMECDHAAYQAGIAGGYKYQGNSLASTIKSFMDAVADDSSVNETFKEETVAIIKWVYEQEESGNAALGMKYMAICKGKAGPKDGLDKQEELINNLKPNQKAL